MRNQFQPGTNSPLKQILQNVLMKKILEYHVCENSIYYSKKPMSKPGKPIKPKKEMNHMIYILNESNDHEFYNILDDEETHFVCEKQGKFKCQV